ncbi:AAA domain-containing protein [Methylopila sp. M107]|uniref:AAA domain-containing protein n=1 Tax=Methylopila sp. M107 TaxID=1101190 RepID=UPI00036D3847|nr:AAA domain-containing protein [Methylopila sp. M107]
MSATETERDDQPVAEPQPFADAISEAGGALPIDDVLFAVLPLLRTVAELHLHGLVAELGGRDVLQDETGRLRLRNPSGQPPRFALSAVKAVQPNPGSALNIIDEVRLTRDSETGLAMETLRAERDPAQPITKPVYLPDFAAWELRLGHHDEITDIFQLGQILACLACGLDFGDPDDVDRFAMNRRNLFVLSGRLNPVLANVILEMTALNRHERATDLGGLVRRLETWRDQPAALDVARVLSSADGAASRRTAVLAHLRDRLFDLSRRNRLLHFKPTQGTVNLTVASVPLVLRLESIRPDQLCVWGGAFAGDVTAGRQIPLRRWLRFEDQPYLPAALDRLIQDQRRDRAEYGFSPLRLVVAFLRWNNLKEAPDERIVSPLLWLPVELVKKKGVTDQYMLQAADGEAEFNPALRHHLRQLYDIRLPETVDLETTSLEAIHADLAAQIRRSEPGVELRLLTRPSVRLVHQRAVQRMQQFQRRKTRDQRRRAVHGRPDFSYDRSDYRPLGLALFEQQVRPSPLPLRSAVGARSRPQPLHMVAPAGAVENVTYTLPEDEGHRFAWDFDLTQVTLSNFSYRKMSLVRDYAQLIDEPAANPAFDRVFSIEPREIEAEAPPPLGLGDQWTVVPADATQTAAAALARTGRSFIIQGPPGTGKSQTITNLIADYAGRGKRVLFVCEKRAALDVVFHRLKQCGLDDLCCLIHDSQTDKKAFVQNLRESYERWAKTPGDRPAHEQARAAATEAITSEMAKIERFEQAMQSAPAALACSVRALVARTIELPAPDPDIGPKTRERLPQIADWDAQRELTGRIVRALRDRFGRDHLAGHPFARLAGALVAHPAAYAEVEARLVACETIADRLDAAFENDAQLLSRDLPLADAVTLTEAARRIADLGLADRLDLLQTQTPASRAFEAERAEVERLATTAAGASAAAGSWREKLTPDDTQAALALARQHEGSLFRFLSSAWRRLAREMERRYDFGRHAVRPRVLATLETLAADHEASAAKLTAERTLEGRYGVRDVDAFARALAELREAVAASPLLRRLLDHLRQAPASARADGAASEAVAELASIAETSFRIGAGDTLEDLFEQLRDLREALDDLPDFIPLLRAMHAAGPAYASALQDIALPPAGIEALVAAEQLARLTRQDPELARFDGPALARAASRAARGEKAILGLNAALVRATQHAKFLDHVRASSLSVSQLDEEGRRFRKNYSTGRRELEHEFGKTMRHRSIRDLAGDETGLVVNDLKPIWLMSPLSVSDTLPLDPDLFDVVIFDEASQIPTEEAAPALSRSAQVVIVGDEMQLPPTSFFSSAVDEEDASVFAEEDGERIAIVLDADSLLNQAARNLPATLLAWHYRSRSEALISFSNAAFYEGRLITVPDRDVGPRGGELTTVRSDDADEDVARATEALLASPVSFLKVEDGVYAARGNAPEARVIARLVRDLLMKETGLSLGVVAFSEAQQGEIETALETLAADDAEFGARLEREYVREDDDQFTGLFVKNLENVQGDERDVILLSICYAPGPDGRMMMNFGPINQRGGEKRLNVIFSRAKRHMAVVSTIRAEAITNVHNDGAAALRAFLQFAEASARGEAERSQAVLGGLNPGAAQAFSGAPPRDAARTALAAALRLRGHTVHEHVGRSQFRCDLAILGEDGDAYALGLLLGPAEKADASGVRERFVFRPSILRSFGWRVVDVPPTDWLNDPDGVLARIEALLASGGEGGAEEEDDVFLPRPVVVDPVAAAPDPDELPATTGERTFGFREGNSDKFWRIGLSGLDVVVAFGRTGTKGQTVVKSFETEERAGREVAKLIAEKVRKGYEEL